LFFGLAGQANAATAIYRSVGAGATSDLNTNSRTVEISGTSATFSDVMPDNMGVGDVLQYQVTGTYYLAFISGRTSSTVYTVQANNGGTPQSTVVGTAVSVYRAYTSLYNSEQGNENDSLNDTVENFDDWTAGGTKDADDVGKNLVSADQIWNIACYAGAGPDTVPSANNLVIAGWTTGNGNFINVFTPFLISEVGVSQRHSGKWTNSAYYINFTTNGIYVSNSYVTLDGLQMKKSANGTAITSNAPYASRGQFLKNNIIWGAGPFTAVSYGMRWTGISGDISLYNNIIYGFNYAGSYGITLSDQVVGDITPYVYNNTVYDCATGIVQDSSAYYSNNISYNNATADFTGTPKAGSAKNFSKDNTANGSNPIHGTADSKNPQFVSVTAGSEDFHLQSNSDAKDVGADISSTFSKDIDTQTRPFNLLWDIGADEYFSSDSDNVAPTVTVFLIPDTYSALSVPVTTFTATDVYGVTGYMLTESSSAPEAGDSRWTATAPSEYTFSTGGAKTLYAWAKDSAGNVSASLNDSVTVTVDNTAPTVTDFGIPATATSLTVTISSFTATDDFGVTGYMLTESGSTPAPGDSGWSATAPTEYSFLSEGTKTLHAWAKDEAGNVSVSLADSVAITLPTYTIGGKVRGLDGTIVLQKNGADNLSLSSNGSFTFSTPLHSGDNYALTILTQPSDQTCAVTENRNGIVAGTNITSIEVTCFSTIALNFSDITSGPKTGNTDGAGGLNENQHGAIVTIWGNRFGSTQGSSKVYFKDSSGVSHEAAHVYYWKNADGTLPGGPADLYTYHKMQEIAFSVPATAADGEGEIYVQVGGVNSTPLPFTVRSGDIKFIKSNGNDSTGNGTWSSPWATLSSTIAGGNSKIDAGDIVYSVGVGTTAGLLVGKTSQIVGTESNPVSVISYPNSDVLVSGNDNASYTIYYNYDNPYWNWSKISVTTVTSGIGLSQGNRIVGVEITGPTAYDGYSGAIGGSNGSGGYGAEGGKYLGVYIHNYGSNPDVPSSGNTGTEPPYPPALKNTWDKFQHLYYISNRSGHTAKAYEIAWNNLTDNPIYSGIHIYDQATCGDWTGFMKIHHNVVRNQRASAINVDLANCSNPRLIVPLDIYDNLLISDTSAVYDGAAFALNAPINVSPPTPSSNIKFYNNTIYGYGASNNLVAGNIDFKNNLIIDKQGLPYIAGAGTPETQGNNLFYSTFSTPPTVPAWATGAINSDPLFTDAANNDFSLTSTSPAINVGSDSILAIAPVDFFGRPRQAGQVDIGSAEFADSEDITNPTITAFEISATSLSLTVPITMFTATDAIGVTGYMLTESSSAPASGDAGWQGTAPTEYVFASAGSKTLYAWAKDAAGNVSTSQNDSVTIALPSSLLASSGGGIPGSASGGSSIPQAKWQTIYPDGKIVFVKETAPNTTSTITYKTDNQPSSLFLRHLQLFQADSEVKRLQAFLNKDPDTALAVSGPGSSGNETNLFGLLTLKAVIKFQEKYAQDILAPWGLIEGTGFVGKTTMAKINKLLGF